jgi:RHS repeat-associated protein
VRPLGSGEDLEAYLYDDRGWRVRKIEDPTGRTTVYFRSQEGPVLSEYSFPTGTPLEPHWRKDYVYALGRHIAAIENTEPDEPAGVASEASDPNAPPWVALSWIQASTPDVYGYHVYRSAGGASGSYTRLTELPLTTPSYTDTDPALTAGVAYHYKLTSVDTATMESRQTAARKITPGDPNAPPTPASFVAQFIEDVGVEASWQGVADLEGDLAGYRVYRGQGPTPPPSGMTSVAGDLPVGTATYTDTTMLPGNTYTYEVRTFDTAGNESAGSQRVTVEIPGEPPPGGGSGGCQGENCPPPIEGRLILPPCGPAGPDTPAPNAQGQFCLPGEVYAALADHTGAEPDWRIIFYHTDHLGTPRVLTDELGDVLSKHAFYPFGEEAPAPWPVDESTNTHWFTGHERDTSIDGDYMLARYYSSTSARFLLPDPQDCGAGPHGPDTKKELGFNRSCLPGAGALDCGFPNAVAVPANLYTYALDNPISFLDPSGATAVHAGLRFLANVDRLDRLRTETSLATPKPKPPTPQDCKRCLDACAMGGQGIRNFCRSIPDPRIRAVCWGLEFTGEVVCRGFCFWYYC